MLGPSHIYLVWERSIENPEPTLVDVFYDVVLANDEVKRLTNELDTVAYVEERTTKRGA